MTSLAINLMSIDHDEVLSTVGSSPELHSAAIESKDSDDEGSTQSSSSTTISKKRKRKLKAVNTWLHGRRHHSGEPERDEKNRLL